MSATVELRRTTSTRVLWLIQYLPTARALLLADNTVNSSLLFICCKISDYLDSFDLHSKPSNAT